MNKLPLLLFSVMLCFVSHAQDYKIDFTASGAITTLDSVHVKNLTQQTELILGGTDTLHLYGGVGIHEEQRKDDEISFYPNPLKEGRGILSFYQNQAAEAEIEIYDMQGKLMLSKQFYLQQGHNEFSLKGMPSGFFLVSVQAPSFSGSMKLLSMDGKRGVPQLQFIQNTPESTKKAANQSIRAAKNLIGMQYNDGEALKFTGYANNLTAVDTIIPVQSQTVNFHYTASYPSGTVHCIPGGAAVWGVTNPTTGETWMDRNLGAFHHAASSTDSFAYGDLYQWGRFSDGHQCRNSGESTILSSSDTPGHGNFIKTSSIPYDWRNPQNNNLWQGVNGTNNPCPSGYRLPTSNELDNERQSWSFNNAAGAYGSPLRLPLAGYRHKGDGLIYARSLSGNYWSSTVSGSYVFTLSFYSVNAGVNSGGYRANGLSVRCIRD